MADSRTFTKLAEFVSTQRTFTWSQIIDGAPPACLIVFGWAIDLLHICRLRHGLSAADA